MRQFRAIFKQVFEEEVYHKGCIHAAATTCPHMPCSGSNGRTIRWLLNEAESDDTVQFLLGTQTMAAE